MSGVLIKRGSLDAETDSHSGGTHVTMKAEIRVMGLHAKEPKIARKLPEAGGEAWNVSLTASQGVALLTPRS